MLTTPNAPPFIPQVPVPKILTVCEPSQTIFRSSTGATRVTRTLPSPPQFAHMQIAIFLAGISLAGMAGLNEFKEVSENLPNPLVDAGVIGVAFYLWVEEVNRTVVLRGLINEESMWEKSMETGQWRGVGG